MLEPIERVFKIYFDRTGHRFDPEHHWDFRQGDSIKFQCDVPLEIITLDPSLKNLFRSEVLVPQRPSSQSANEFVLQLPNLSPFEVDEALLQHNGEYICRFRFDIYFKGQPTEYAVINKKIGHLLPSGSPAPPSPKQRPIGDPTAAILDDSLDLERPESVSFLRNVQCNIVKGHSREFGRLLMVKFSERSIAVRRKWLSEIADLIITSALEQSEQTTRWKRLKDSGVSAEGEPLASIALSSSGYLALGLAGKAGDDATSSGPHNSTTQSQAVPTDDEFAAGMKQSNSGYGASWEIRQEDWESAYRNSEIHLCVLLADDNEKRLTERVLYIKQKVAEVGEVVADEAGKRRIHRHLKGSNLIEHFGFRDGISNPKFIQGEEQPGEYWSPGPVPLKLLFVQEPLLPGTTRDGQTYGSYLAFLKIEQNVRKFMESSQELATALEAKSGSEVCPHHAGALAVGRAADGSPLVAEVGRHDNDFDYESSDCPRHAHVRRMNPRQQGSFAMARRSMHYGPEREDLYPGVRQAPPDRGVGLLFLSYQSEIQRFSSRMAAANRPVKGGVDSLIGAKRTDLGTASDRDGTQTWRTATGDVRFLMADFVTLRGGEYFFCPSVPFFRKLPTAAL